MSTDIIRLKQQILRKENKKYSNTFSELTSEQIKDVDVIDAEFKPFAAWRNKAFLVMQYAIEGHAHVTRLSVCRTQIRGDGRWIDGITWDELQQIKTALGFGDKVAIEFYPPVQDVVNVANIRHLWLFESEPPTLGFMWKKKGSNANEM